MLPAYSGKIEQSCRQAAARRDQSYCPANGNDSGQRRALRGDAAERAERAERAGALALRGRLPVAAVGQHGVLNADRPAGSLPSTQRLAIQYLFLYSLSGGDDLATRISPDNRIAKIVVLLHDDSTHYGAERIADAKKLLDGLLPAGFAYRVAGTLASNGALTEALVAGKIRNIAQISLITIAVQHKSPFPVLY